ncbi:tape measure protein, partial [Sutcliffiella cohnii]
EEGEKLTRYLSLTGDAAAIAGSSLGEMGSIFNKVQTSNKAYNGELQQLSDRGLPIYQWLADEAGVAADAVFDMASKGEISSEMLMKAIEKNIGGAAQKMGEESFTAGVANMWAAVGRLGASFLDAGGKGGGFFSQLKPLIGDFTKRIDTMGDFAEKAGVKFGEFFTGFIDKAKSVKAMY